jgi:hypothetical protein
VEEIRNRLHVLHARLGVGEVSQVAALLRGEAGEPRLESIANLYVSAAPVGTHAQFNTVRVTSRSWCW